MYKEFYELCYKCSNSLKNNQKKRGTCDPLSFTFSTCIPVTKLASFITKKILPPPPPPPDTWCYDVVKLYTLFFSLDYNLQDLPNLTLNTKLGIHSSWTVGIQRCNGMPVSFPKANTIFHSQKTCRNSFNFSEKSGFPCQSRPEFTFFNTKRPLKFQQCLSVL